MKIVLDISNKLFGNVLEEIDDDLIRQVIQANICFGDTIKLTKLPKGYGRLGDLDALEVEMVNGIKAGNHEEGYEEYAHINDVDDCVECVKYAETIIPADEAEGEE